MHLIDADKAQHGLTIVAGSQTGGKGQRGKSWTDKPGESLLMSMITVPRIHLGAQFLFNTAVAVTVANVLQKLSDTWQVKIKWPNDIIINDKKAGGILIENVIRGSQWSYSVIGLGLNIRQNSFPEDLPHATSLKIASSIDYEVSDVRDMITSDILQNLSGPITEEIYLTSYNNYLYKRGQMQQFSDASGHWEARLVQANNDGTLTVQLADGSITNYFHGQALWEW
jgi:BirA family biotin operon repressor/biotin-[acetyl-CoA-carboxylase] ligase